MQVKIGEKAPNLKISEWIQGTAANFDQLAGKVVLVEVFQVNCPGCFLYALPEAINLHTKYQNQGLIVLGLATAFEDFDKNTADNLRLLAQSGEVVGETWQALNQQGMLKNNKLPYRIPFPLAMDQLTKNEKEIDAQQLLNIVSSHVTDFETLPNEQQLRIMEQVRKYLIAKNYHAGTFEGYNLQGTPSSILVDTEGRLSSVAFGQSYGLEQKICALLKK